jgi:hypothetical protein
LVPIVYPAITNSWPRFTRIFSHAPERRPERLAYPATPAATGELLFEFLQDTIGSSARFREHGARNRLTLCGARNVRYDRRGLTDSRCRSTASPIAALMPLHMKSDAP